MKHLICTECSRIIPVCDSSARKEDLPCTIDGCDGFMEPIDEEMVPVINMLTDMGYPNHIFRSRSPQTQR